MAAARPARRCTPPRSKPGVPAGRWMGRGLAALGLAPGQEVTEQHLRNLFGERGRHPYADRIEADRLAAGDEPWAGEPEVLAEAAEAGRRAAAWIRSLPAPPVSSPVGTWLARTLPDAGEAAMSSRDPAQCDRRGPGGRLIEGTAGTELPSLVESLRKTAAQRLFHLMNRD
ncbi:relaxase domain-containing protein [Streptomyces microflavus]|uniref:relaxase domain-containing protein n=1 Tax=Streptomyces microflavus TaxID=1919 RepID=UPI0034365A65